MKHIARIMDGSWSGKLLCCVLAVVLSLYALPLTYSRAFAAEEGRDVAGMQDVTADQGTTPNAPESGSPSETPENQPQKDDPANTTDKVEGGGTSSDDGSDPSTGKDAVLPGDVAGKITEPVIEAPEDEQGESAPVDPAEIVEVPSALGDDEIAEALSVFEGSGEVAEDEEEGIESRSISGSGAVKTYAGASMFETAVAEAKAAYPSGSSTAVIVGPGDAWVDALASAGLAASKGPILFTERDSLYPATRQALKDLGVKSVVIVGGTAAISAKAEKAIADTGISVEARLAGADCYETQMKIYEYGLNQGLWNSDLAIVATGSHYGDALSVSPVAYAKKAPIFLAYNGELPSAQKTALKNASVKGTVKTVAIMGGTASVSSRAEGFIYGVVGEKNSKRLGGATQYETSATIAKWAVSSQGFSWDNAAFTTGLMPYDALAGSVLQGKSKSVMLLVADQSSATIKEASANKGSIFSIRFFGGTAAISPSLRTYIINCVSDKITYENAGVSYSRMASLEKVSASQFDPDQWGYEDDEFYQFAKIDEGYSGKVTAAQLNAFIARYGSSGKLAGTGQTFIDAAKASGTNEVYLLSHAILESGWGKSELAMGYKYDGKTKINGKTYKAGTYYNFFGIGAYDSSPLSGGRAAAIINGWNTPEKAIKGAAKWISDGYLNNSYDQNTLYEMRWNYTQAASEGAVWKQYATSPTWATGIANVMANCYSYNKIDKSNTGLKFLVPLYS